MFQVRMPLPPATPPEPIHIVDHLPLTARVAQSGAVSGIRNMLFTAWLPPGAAFAGLSGRITLAGNHDGFSEALVMLGYSGEDRAACVRRDSTVSPVMPAISRLWAGILKSNYAAQVRLPISVALPVPISPPRPEQGACLTTLISAGYPFLRPDVPLYTTTEVRLSVAVAPPGGKVVPFGLGGEFKFPAGSPLKLHSYVGLRAERPLVLEALAAALSAAPVAGAPASAGWGPALRGQWRVSTEFVHVPAPVCAAARYQGHRVNEMFSVLRMSKPAAISPPPGSTLLLDIPLDSVGPTAAQVTRFAALGVSGHPVRLEVGDCLMAFEGAAPGHEAGNLDVENQTTAYLQPE